jgi:GNAT superfamily N-acetyltransferase
VKCETGRLFTAKWTLCIVARVAESVINHDEYADETNRAVGERWRRLDPLLPAPGLVPGTCGERFRTADGDGYAVCRHLVMPASSLDQTWAAATEYILSPRVAGPDVRSGLDQLLTQWREHVSGIAEAHDEDTAAKLSWPSRDTTGVRALQRHGFTPMTVVAARPARRAIAPGAAADVTVRQAGPADLTAAAGFEMAVIRYDEQFGVGQVRPATEQLVRESMVKDLNRQPSWIWLAEDDRTREPAGLLILQPPERAGWVARAVGLAPVAYLATMFVQPGERGAGVGAALVSHAHAAVDDVGAGVTLLHYAQVNPVSGPFWSRMGYRPLWTYWEVSPAAFLR